jgi:hypothetical protein
MAGPSDDLCHQLTCATVLCLTLQDLVFPILTAMFNSEISWSFRNSNCFQADCPAKEWSDVRSTEFSDCSFQWEHTVISVTYELCLYNFTFMWPCIVTNFFIIKPTRCTNFPNFLRHETLHVSSSSVPSWSCSKAVYKPVWHTPVPSVQWINSWWWAEELPETWRVSCRSKSGKLVHLVGFIIKKCVCIMRIAVILQRGYLLLFFRGAIFCYSSEGLSSACFNS